MRDIQKEIQKKTETLEEQLRRLSMVDGKLPDEKYDDEPETIDVEYTEVNSEETTDVEKENE